MTKDLISLFEKNKELKHNAKEIKKIITDALAANSHYIQLKEDYKIMRDDLAMIRDSVYDDFVSEINNLEKLKNEADDNNLMITDVAINNLLEGKTVEVVDKDGFVYEPIWSVKFKKTNIIKK
jgi:hypothetical protein